MSSERKVLVYGASGYTGKLVSESLAQRNIPFYMAGRTRSRLEDALKIVEERHGAPVDAEIVVASNSPEELRPLFDQVDVVINVSGPFMQLGWPIVETALAAQLPLPGHHRRAGLVAGYQREVRPGVCRQRPVIEPGQLLYVGGRRAGSGSGAGNRRR